MDEAQPPLWQKIVAYPASFLFPALHFSVCVVLTVFVHPERARYRYYEYYAPWGWRPRTDMPDEWRGTERTERTEGENNEG